MTKKKINAIFQINTEANLDERLRSKGWSVQDGSGCWIFGGRKILGGYGAIDYMGKAIVASRASYMAWVGEIEKGLQVCHSCDNPPCINPQHLYLGDQSRNMTDASKRRRLSSAKLDKESVRQIRERYSAGGVLMKELAKEYGTSVPNIHAVINKKSWRWVD